MPKPNSKKERFQPIPGNEHILKRTKGGNIYHAGQPTGKDSYFIQVSVDQGKTEPAKNLTVSYSPTSGILSVPNGEDIRKVRAEISDYIGVFSDGEGLSDELQKNIGVLLDKLQYL